MNHAMLHYETFTEDLENIISQEPIMSKFVLGVYAADMLPISIFSRNVGLIANTDEASYSGKHWIAIFIPDSGNPEFFDPLGYGPNHYISHFENFLVNRGPDYRYNAQKIQSDTSSNCGLFCIFFLYLRSRTVPFQDIVESFSNQPSKNDVKVLNFMRNSFLK